MHEMSIVSSLMDQIEDVAEKNNLMNVQEVELEVGELKQVIPEIMQDAYKIVTEETRAKGSVLVITLIKAKVKCQECEDVFNPQIDNFVCARCQRANVQVLQGNEIILKTVIGQKNEDINEGRETV